MQEQSDKQDELIEKPDYDSIKSFKDLEPRATAQDHGARIDAIKDVLKYYNGLEEPIKQCETQEALKGISLDDPSQVTSQDQDDRIDPNQPDIAAKKTELEALKRNQNS